MRLRVALRVKVEVTVISVGRNMDKIGGNFADTRLRQLYQLRADTQTRTIKISSSSMMAAAAGQLYLVVVGIQAALR